MKIIQMIADKWRIRKMKKAFEAKNKKAIKYLEKPSPAEVESPVVPV
jgi:hypothetical protein